MGNVFRGIPVEMTKRLQAQSGARLFIETGTQKGLSVQAVAGLFDRIITIEANPAVHAAAKQALAHLSNVTVLPGRSEQVLKRLALSVNEPAIVWLDAHALRGATADEFCALGGRTGRAGRLPGSADHHDRRHAQRQDWPDELADRERNTHRAGEDRGGLPHVRGNRRAGLRPESTGGAR